VDDDDDDLNKRAVRASTLQQRVLRDRHTASHAKVEKSVLIMKETLWKNDRNLMNDVRTISIDFIIIAILVSGKKIEGIIFFPRIVRQRQRNKVLKHVIHVDVCN